MSLKDTGGAGSGYKSPIDLQLGQMPKTEDPQAFAELVELYNAVHLLNAYLDRLRSNLEVGIKGEPLENQLPFRRGIWAKCGPRPITAGMQICLENRSPEQQLIPGLELSSKRVPAPMHGVALTDAEPGQDCQMGMGPAILKVTGVQPFEWINGGKFDQDFAGKFLRGSAGKWVSAGIGMGIRNDYFILFGRMF